MSIHVLHNEHFMLDGKHRFLDNLEIDNPKELASRRSDQPDCHSWWHSSLLNTRGY